MVTILQIGDIAHTFSERYSGFWSNRSHEEGATAQGLLTRKNQCSRLKDEERFN